MSSDHHSPPPPFHIAGLLGQSKERSPNAREDDCMSKESQGSSYSSTPSPHQEYATAPSMWSGAAIAPQRSSLPQYGFTASPIGFGSPPISPTGKQQLAISCFVVCEVQVLMCDFVAHLFQVLHFQLFYQPTLLPSPH